MLFRAGSDLTGKRLLVLFTCARACGDSGDDPWPGVRLLSPLALIDIWGWIILCGGGQS